MMLDTIAATADMIKDTTKDTQRTTVDDELLPAKLQINRFSENLCNHLRIKIQNGLISFFFRKNKRHSYLTQALFGWDFLPGFFLGKTINCKIRASRTLFPHCPRPFFWPPYPSHRFILSFYLLIIIFSIIYGILFKIMPNKN